MPFTDSLQFTRFIIEIFDTQSSPYSRAANLAKIEVISNVKLSSILPGGCAQFSFRVWVSGRRTIFTAPAWLGYNYEVRIYDDELCCWLGRIEDILPHQGKGGSWFDVVCYGLGVNLDDRYYTSQNVSGQQTSVIVSDAITNLTSQIDVTTITASGFTLSGATAINLKMMTAAQVANWAKLFGNSSDNPMDWTVFPQEDGDSEFIFEPRPTTPDVTCRLAEFEESSWGLVGRQFGNRAVAQYNDGASTATENDTALQAAGPAGRNLIRTGVIFVPQITQAADGTQAAQVLLTAIKNLRMTATRLVCKTNVEFKDSNGQRLQPWRVRAGQLLEFTDIAPIEGQAGTFTYNNAALLASAEYDEMARTLSLLPESFDVFMQREVARARRLLQGRHQVAGAL